MCIRDRTSTGENVFQTNHIAQLAIGGLIGKASRPNRSKNQCQCEGIGIWKSHMWFGLSSMQSYIVK